MAKARIPLVDLRAQHDANRSEIWAAIERVIESSQFIMGEEVERLEAEFAAFCGARYAVGTSSGTTALQLALLALGVGPGDEVITTPHTFIATAEAVSHVGARPVFVDIDTATYTMDPGKLEAAITPRTKAVIPVHLYGHPADMRRIMEIARRRHLVVLEDAAQAHGAVCEGRKVGAWGDVAAFSFYPGKNLGAMGDAGAVVTNDEAIARQVKLLRNHGRAEKYEHQCVGYNARLDTLQAAVLRVKLRRLEEWNRRRRAIAQVYGQTLAGTPLVIPSERPGCQAVYHLYVVRSPQRDLLREHLRPQGVETGIHYPLPLHLQPAYSALGYRAGAFPCTEQAAREVLSLPMYPEMTEEQVRQVSAAVVTFFASPVAAKKAS
ncbi:MAG: DegT/DnrJ/EryC1/StrS family aminotransferase [Dehalococcoidia bacterium]|nr:DegT/DnrJ/EryC1/StrS family aminotransferase [Dehalococcoidia bacterium]